MPKQIFSVYIKYLEQDEHFFALKYSFKNVQFFLNSNKIANKTKIKPYLIFLLNPQYFFIFGKVILFPLSYFGNRNN